MNAEQRTLSLGRPDDCHLHLRDGAALAAVIGHTCKQFARAIVMPNLAPPVTTVAMAEDYRRRILAALPAGAVFTPLMTLYLTDVTPAGEIRKARDSSNIVGVKLYPAGATTHSDAGVTNVERCYPILEVMADCGLPLLVHGEVTDPAVDIFDRERVFMERVLQPLVKTIPGLKIVFEHITTREAVDFVTGGPATLAATITAHHLLYHRNVLLAGGLRPHYYCLPVLKTETDRAALITAATSGNPRFFLGTDSAPHARRQKEAACGCAGIYTAHAALELYARAFAAAGRLDRLEAFASQFGARFYGLERNPGKVTLAHRPWTVPDNYPFADDMLVPLCAGETLDWHLA